MSALLTPCSDDAHLAHDKPAVALAALEGNAGEGRAASRSIAAERGSAGLCARHGCSSLRAARVARTRRAGQLTTALSLHHLPSQLSLPDGRTIIYGGFYSLYGGPSPWIGTPQRALGLEPACTWSLGHCYMAKPDGDSHGSGASLAHARVIALPPWSATHPAPLT